MRRELVKVVLQGEGILSSAFRVVTDVADIAKLNRMLGQQLRKIFEFKKTREITYPSGHHSETIFFEKNSGKDVRAWCHYTYDGKLVNTLLVGDPSSQAWMEVEVYLNFPAETYNRRVAGTFVVDEEGSYFVAHRGKLTKGKSGLHKSKVLREFASQTVEAQDNNQKSTVILISSLEDTRLADRLWTFAQEARQVAIKIGAESGSPAITAFAPSNERSTPITDPSMRLRTYFDEYAGTGHSKGYGGGKRVVEHGDIVKSLEAQLRNQGESQKSRTIDLAIVSDKIVDLYEVKTSTRTTDLYAGVGQLLIHGECIHELLHKKVRRYLVLPEKPREQHGKHISGKAGIKIITFTKTGVTYQFHGTN